MSRGIRDLLLRHSDNDNKTKIGALKKIIDLFQDNKGIFIVWKQIALSLAGG
jgi:hypothetical protein